MSALTGLLRRRLRMPATALDGVVVLEGKGLALSYGANPILADVDVVARAGQVLALVGPNGAGKSTLLGVLSGDHRPDRGEVLIDGAPLGEWSANELAVRRGVLLQRVEVSFPFTVTQVVRLGRAPWAGTPGEDWDDVVIAEALRETDIARFSQRAYPSLSGGERSRAALARVLAQEPSVLMLDEPTASLDLGHQEQILTLARRRAARGDAVVVVLHDLGLAAAYADVVMVLDRGAVRAVGTPTEVLTAELLSEVYHYPVEVLRHPRTDALIILPHREGDHEPAL